jgi:hypothetical protein
MTKEQNSTTLPSPELRAKWRSEAPRNRDAGISREDYLMDRAAEWSADQELEACCDLIKKWFANPVYRIAALRSSRRPKPPSLKEQALDALDRLSRWNGDHEAEAFIRRALEAFPDES